MQVTAKLKTVAGLEINLWGDAGPRVLLVHGNLLSGVLFWSEQRVLGRHWRLEVLNRRGYGRSIATERQDFEIDATDIIEALEDGAHLVGHSYGALGALYAAARRPQAIRSLTVIEPPAFALAKGNEAADRLAQQIRQLQESGPREPAAYAQAFAAALGSSPKFPSPLPPPIERAVRVLMNGRGPWEADVPLEALQRTSLPVLVVSGGHHPGLEAICDVLQRELKAQRAVIRGAGHNVARTGAPFNERLEAFLRAAGA